MTKAERERQRAELLKALHWWTAQRADAIRANDADALAEAEAGRANTLAELEKLARNR